MKMHDGVIARTMRRMTAPLRVALVHTGAVVIGPVGDLVRDLLPGVVAVNYLDDRIVADLGDPARAASVPARIEALVRAAASAGADAVMLTCSSISPWAAPTAASVGIPVLRIDEAMADEAVATAERIAVIATLPTTLAPTVGLLRERAALAGRTPTLITEVVEGAFAAVSAGDRAMHDALVGAAIARRAADADAVVLAQASMASAAASVTVAVPVLTSTERGVRRLRDVVRGGAAAG